MNLFTLRQVVDDDMKRLENLTRLQRTPISCGGVGCNGCCRGEIEVTAEEWKEIRQHIPDEVLVRIGPPPKRAKDREARICPLLGSDGGCSVYAVRPLACRAYAVLTPADWCWPERAGPQKVLKVMAGGQVLVQHILIADLLWLQNLLWEERQRRFPVSS